LADEAIVQRVPRIVIATTFSGAWDTIIDQVELNGFRVEVATGATCSIETAATCADLVVSDLPVGVGMLATLRNNPRTIHIPCIQILPEGEASMEAFRHAMDLGADDCIPQTSVATSLIASLRNRLRLRDAILWQGSEDRLAESFDTFAEELFDAISQDLSVPEVLEVVGRRICAGLQGAFVTCALNHSGQMETVEATAIPSRTWGHFDDLLLNLADSNAPQPLPPVLMDFLRLRCAALDGDRFPAAVWRLPIHNVAGEALGAFFVFLSKERDYLLRSSDIRSSLVNRWCKLAAVLLDRQRLDEEISRRTHYDALTGLPNRSQFERHLQEAIRTADGFAMLVLDIDRFQRFNEVRGYEAADQLLIQIAERLRACCRIGDLFARLAGDEFAMLLPGNVEPDTLRHLGERLLDALAKPFVVAGTTVMMQASIGICRFPHDGSNLQGLFNSCEIALSQARGSRGGHIAFFHPLLGRQTIDGQDIEHYLAEALRQKRFELFYQPQFQVGGRLCGFEALIRLRADDDRLVQPGIFLPAAEESDLIVPIGAWVLEEACRQVAVWREAGLGAYRISINVSPRQLSHFHFLDSLGELLARLSVDPRSIEFELTESTLMNDIQSSLKILRQIRKLGVGLAIDDFGTGYSSLSYLHELPVDKVKIDQCFVKRIGSEDSTCAIIDAIVSLSSGLGARILAEGVETADQYRVLAARGCHEVQGYLFSRPLSIEAAHDFIAGPGQNPTEWFLDSIDR
jgi:diguanylate cyclase (GGDEF)-like protein